MTQVVTVHTDFADLNQMTQGLVGRVNETHVILPAGEPVDVGEWVQFAVTLSDGTPGFAGFGRCVTSLDNGEERMAHQRFDVVFDSLQFDPRGQEIFSHILTLGDGSEEAQAQGEAGQAEAGQAEAYGEEAESHGEAESYGHAEATEGDDEAFEDVGSDVLSAPGSLAPAAQASDAYADVGAAGADDDYDDATMVASDSAQRTYAEAVSVIPGDVSEVVEEEGDPYAVQEPSYGQAYGDNGQAYNLDADPYAESEPEPGHVSEEAPIERPDELVAPSEDDSYAESYAQAGPDNVNGSTATFVYPGGLPLPAMPPRPELEPSLRVQRAPRPPQEG